MLSGVGSERSDTEWVWARSASMILVTERIDPPGAAPAATQDHINSGFASKKKHNRAGGVNGARVATGVL